MNSNGLANASTRDGVPEARAARDGDRIPEAWAARDGDRIPEAWAALMTPDALRRADELSKRADECRAAGEIILPPRQRTFRALKLTPPANVRCVILGQDPYHTPGVANGLAFSANPDCKIPPSLRNIFKELASDLGCPMPTRPDLTPWAAQGVLLLNVTLTVRAGAAGSHAKWGWQSVTEEILRVCQGLPQPVMFLLWGRHAQAAAQKAGIALTDAQKAATAFTDAQKAATAFTDAQKAATAFTDAQKAATAFTDAQKTGIPLTDAQIGQITLAEWNRNLSEHVDAAETRPLPDAPRLFKQDSGAKCAYCSTHPSPLGASKGTPTLPAFLGSRPFSRTNDFLRACGSPEISWALS